MEELFQLFKEWKNNDPSRGACALRIFEDQSGAVIDTENERTAVSPGVGQLSFRDFVYARAIFRKAIEADEAAKKITVEDIMSLFKQWTNNTGRQMHYMRFFNDESGGVYSGIMKSEHVLVQGVPVRWGNLREAKAVLTSLIQKGRVR